MQRTRESIALLLPGLFVVSTGAFAVFSWTHEELSRFLEVATSPQYRELTNTFLTVGTIHFLLVLLYLRLVVGNLFRAVAVNHTDWNLFVWMPRLRRSAWDETLYKERFPYVPAQFKVYKVLRLSSLIESIAFPFSRLSDLGDETLRSNESPEERDASDAHTVFDFMKMRLSVEGTEAYRAVRVLEERVRLFHGMLLALPFAFLAAIAVLLSPLAQVAPACRIASYILLTCCVVAIYTLITRIRRIRGEEVTMTFMAYLAHFHAASPTDSTSATLPHGSSASKCTPSFIPSFLQQLPPNLL